MSGVPSTPSTPGRATAVGEPLEQVAAAGHRHPVVAHAEAPRGRVVGGDDEQAAVVADQRPAVARGPGLAMRCGSRTRISVRSATDTVGLVVITSSAAAAACAAIGSRVARWSSTSASSAWRSSTRAARRRWPRRRWRTRGRRRSQPAQQAVAEGAAEGVAGAEAVDHLDRERRHLDPLVRVAASTPLGPCLTTASLDAALEQGVGRPVRVGLADGDLALLAVADGDRHVLERLADLGAWPRPGAARTSAGSRGRGRCAAPAAGLPGGEVGAGWAPATGR